MGSPTGAAGGIITTRRTKGAADRAIQGGSIGETLYGLENLLLPYNELVSTGRIAPGTTGGLVGGLQPGESVLGRDLSRFESGLASADPAYAALRNANATALDFTQNGLPADIERGITQGVRSSASQRGLLDSGTAGLEEVAALMGGREQLRAQRMQQVGDFLQGTTNAYLNKIFPDIGTLYQGELSRAINRAQNTIGAAQVGAGIYGQSQIGGGGGQLASAAFT